MSDEQPVPRQRLGVYAVIVDGGDLLLTRISPRGVGTGRWTLPGGGLDHGEDPRDGVVREVREETGLEVEVGALLEVQSSHFVGRAPHGVLEDFHAVRLVFAATVAASARGSERVVEIDGTTDAVAWVPLDRVDADDRPATDVARLGRDLARQSRGSKTSIT